MAGGVLVMADGEMDHSQQIVALGLLCQMFEFAVQSQRPLAQRECHVQLPQPKQTPTLEEQYRCQFGARFAGLSDRFSLFGALQRSTDVTLVDLRGADTKPGLCP